MMLRVISTILTALACALAALPGPARSEGCTSVVSAMFSDDGMSVIVESSKDLSNVVLKFCDGSADFKYDGLSGTSMTLSGAAGTLAGVWIKSGCNFSGDGPGYGVFVANPCKAPHTPTSTAIPTHTAAVTASPTPALTITAISTPTATPDENVKVCHSAESGVIETILIDKTDLEEHLAHGDSEGECFADCMGIPRGKAAIDKCRVCGGDNSTCKDCAGIVNGQARIDLCGVCGGDGTTCQGCDGLANSGKVADACGVCGGDNSSCKDCRGIPGGGAVIDECGVCGGDSSSCKDCTGAANGSVRVDECGICGGTSRNSCDFKTECSGTFDKCGVCNGNGACLDCAGVPNGGAKIDCCGVCGGDGSTCLDKCRFYHMRAEKRVMKKQINSLYSSILGYTKLQQKCSPANKSLSKRNRLAADLRKKSLEMIRRYIPDNFKVCHTAYCTKTNFGKVLTALKRNATRLSSITREAQSYHAGGACGRGMNKSGTAGASAVGRFHGSIGKVPPVRCD